MHMVPKMIVLSSSPPLNQRMSFALFLGQSFEGAFLSNGRILTEIDIMYSRANYERLLQVINSIILL